MALKTLKTLGTAEHTIHKSRFIAKAQRCETERELALFLRQFAAEHQSAGHLAYAFRLKTAEGIVARYSDAGEPSGTAGKPMMQMLDGQGLVNCCVAVVRYYGGINLGTGGLVRAYGGTAKAALDAAQTVDFVEMQTLSLTVDYAQVDSLLRAAAQCEAEVLDKSFDAQAHITLRLPVSQVMALQAKFKAV